MKILYAQIIVLAILAGFSMTRAASAQDVSCTMMACVSGLTIDVPPDRPWPAGDYRFRFVLDGVETACAGRLPLKSCGTNSISCDRPGITIMENGCALPPENQGFGMIVIDSLPAAADVTITRDGQMVFHRAYTPAYKDAAPNGAQCEPKCRQATVPFEP